MAEGRNLEELKTSLLKARGCPARSAIIESAMGEGFVSCETCGAFKTHVQSMCHECGMGATPLGANIARENI